MIIGTYAFLLFGATEARTWTDVVDRSIYLQPNLDTSRLLLKMEIDPLLRLDDAGNLEPSPEPATGTWITKSPAPTYVPTAIPSDMPSLAPTGPTSSPTIRSENIEGNGGCPDGTVLYRVNMYDSWGDGWSGVTQLVITGVEDQDTTAVIGSTVTKTHTTQQGDTTVSITQTVELTSDHPFGTAPSKENYKYVHPLGRIFEGNLHAGSRGNAWVCLMPRRCYEVVVSGGDYLEEVSWSIEGVFGERDVPLVQGGAPSDCSFSIPDENGVSFCEATCSSTLNPAHTQSPAITDHLTPIEGNDGDVFELSPGSSGGATEAKDLGYQVLHAIENGDA